jgi:hypothetical protein
MHACRQAAKQAPWEKEKENPKTNTSLLMNELSNREQRRFHAPQVPHVPPYQEEVVGSIG